jgi:predicted metal-dependent hydrolase
VYTVGQSSVDAHRFAEGIKLFNSAEFFEAHEVLEDVWRAAPAEEKKFLQGLIQAAVAFHHHSTGNAIGARSLLARAQRNLSGFPREFKRIHLERLLESLSRWEAALEDGQPVPPLPRI